MKKLILVDHNGVIQQKFDVFVEGSDFTFAFTVPTCVWLGKVMLVDEVPDAITEVEDLALHELEMAEFLPVTTPISEEKIEEIEQEIRKEKGEEVKQARLDISMKCYKCDWEGELDECSFGHDDYYCPQCLEETLKEVEIHELETDGDKSGGDSRIDTSIEPKSIKKLHKKSAGRKATKGSNKPRDRKAT